MAGSEKKRLLLLSSYSKSLVIFRGDLIRELVAAGWEVITAAPETGFEKEIEELGASFVRVPLARASMNPWDDLKFLFAVHRLLDVHAPEAVLSYNIKPVVYLPWAAFGLGKRIRKAAMITGLGHAFTASRKGLSYYLASFLYRLGLKAYDAIFFQNPDDLEAFLKLGIIKSEDLGKVKKIAGSGVNLERFGFHPLPEIKSGGLTFVMIARLLREKGVMEYLEAAAEVRKIWPGASMWLVGPLDPNPTALSAAEIQPYISDGTITYVGEVDDVREVIARSHVLVLPSYREGTPRTVLEAMATGRPVIVTNVPGCRETIVNGENGLSIPARDSAALATAMSWMIENPEALPRMGEKGRALAEDRFDVKKVNQNIIEHFF